jgi:Leucine-rich repeat (LRR) protein
LEELNLSANNLSKTLPDCVSMCSSLVHLDVSNNHLQVGKQPTYKQVLAMHDKHRRRPDLRLFVQVLPASLSKLAQLEVLNAARNELATLPKEMIRLHRLQVGVYVCCCN